MEAYKTFIRSESFKYECDVMAVINGVYPRTAEAIRNFILKRAMMILSTDKDRRSFYDNMHRLTRSYPLSANRCITSEQIKEVLDNNYNAGDFSIKKIFEQEVDDFDVLRLEAFNLSTGYDLMEEAININNTAKTICKLSGKNISDTVRFLLSAEQEIKPEEQIETIQSRDKLSERILNEIRTYVSEGKDIEDKKKRRIEMAIKFNISVRHVGIITAWIKRGISEKKPENKEEIKGENNASIEDKHVSKRELLREYLDDFFEGHIQHPKECAITYRDMHDCFFRDTKIAIDYTEVPKMWQKLLEEQQKKSSIEAVESGRHIIGPITKSCKKLNNGDFVIDKSCNVLLQNEINHLMDSNK